MQPKMCTECVTFTLLFLTGCMAMHRGEGGEVNTILSTPAPKWQAGGSVSFHHFHFSLPLHTCIYYLPVSSLQYIYSFTVVQLPRCTTTQLSYSSGARYWRCGIVHWCAHCAPDFQWSWDDAGSLWNTVISILRPDTFYKKQYCKASSTWRN